MDFSGLFLFSPPSPPSSLFLSPFLNFFPGKLMLEFNRWIWSILAVFFAGVFEWEKAVFQKVNFRLITCWRIYP